MKQNGTKRLTISYLALTAALLALFMLNIFCGSTALSPKDILSTIFSAGNNALAQKIIFGLRLPRAAMVVLLGAALSVAGYLLQTFFANPIAGPFVMGVSGGAKLAVALTMVVLLNHGLFTSSLTLILASFVGAMVAMGFVLAVSQRVKRAGVLVICGVMISYICSAVTDVVVAFAQDSNIVNLHNWSMGSFSWHDVGECPHGGFNCVAMPCVFVYAFQTDGGVPNGRSLCAECRRFRASVLSRTCVVIQPARGMRHGICGADLLCRHRGAASRKAHTPQCKAFARAAGVRFRRCSILPFV